MIFNSRHKSQIWNLVTLTLAMSLMLVVDDKEGGEGLVALGEAEDGPQDSHIWRFVTPQPGHVPHVNC